MCWRYYSGETVLINDAHNLQGTYVKGTKDDIEEFIYQLLDVSDDGVVGRYNFLVDLSGKFITPKIPLKFLLDIVVSEFLFFIFS